MLLVLLSLLSCSQSVFGGRSGGDTSPGAPGREPVEKPDPEPMGEDETAVRALIEGAADLDAVLHDVAWNDGFPVHTRDDTWLFVVDDDTRAWKLAGDFNDWNPARLNEGDGFLWAEVTIDDPEGAQYKFTEDATWIADPWAHSYTWDDFGEISYVVPPTDTWHLERLPDFAFAGLVPRDVRVFVPGGQGPWPVLYTHDGQNLFDPGALWGGWRLQEALVEETPMLVVGIDNTADRMDEYAHVQDDIGVGSLVGGKANQYAQLVITLRGEIESRYDTSGTNGLMGSSMGGLASLYIAHVQPGQWDFVASLSGTLGWGRFGVNAATLEELYVAAQPLGAVVYADSGGGPGADNACIDVDGDGAVEDDPDASDNYCTSRAFVDALAADGYVWGVDLHHWWAEDAPHNEAAWAARVARPLALFGELN